MTDKGIVMEVRPVHPENALMLKLVTLHITPLGSVIVGGIVIAPVAVELVATVATVTLVV